MTQIVLQPDDTAGVDAHIVDNSYADVNQGSQVSAGIGTALYGKGVFHYRLLLHLDLTEIPAGAIITGASLTLHTVTDSNGVGATFQANRLTQPDWTELGATWNVYDGTQAWQSAGGDFTTTDADTTTLTASNADLVFSDLTNLVIDALENRDGKLELIITGPEGTETSLAVFSTSEDSTAALRPKLTVDYIPVPSLTISDHADGTGATATIGDADPSGTTTVLVRGFDGELGSGAWSIIGSTTGNGDVAMSLPIGHYFAYAVSRVANVQVPSPVLYFVVSDGVDSIHSRCLDSVQARIRLLELEGIDNEHVVIEKLPTRRDPYVSDELPAIVVSPERTTIPASEGTNGTDDVHYDVIVSIYDEDNQEPTLEANLDRYLKWRQQISRAFRNQRLPGVPEVINSEVEPAECLLHEAWKCELMASAIRLRFISRETRGF